MLMDNQNQTEISPNPQTTNGQTLAAETTNLQPSTVNINNSDNKIKITSVGDVGLSRSTQLSHQAYLSHH